MANVEQVLVVERSVLDRVGAFDGLTFEIDRYLDAFFAPGVLRFIPRPDAENDPSFKQLIPYVLMGHGDSFFSYVRGARGGEKRLVGNRSIGIGGHINPVDDSPLFSNDYWATYCRAVEREVTEEVIVETGYSDRIVALLNDDSTEVGQVHLGIVHLWQLEAPAVRKREQVITQQAFMTTAELQADAESLESWSRFCIDEIRGLKAAAKENASPRRIIATNQSKAQRVS